MTREQIHEVVKGLPAEIVLALAEEALLSEINAIGFDDPDEQLRISAIVMRHIYETNKDLMYSTDHNCDPVLDASEYISDDFVKSMETTD
jgi:hypothetical protein